MIRRALLSVSRSDRIKAAVAGAPVSRNVVTRFVGVEHPEVVAPEEPLSRGRKIVVVITWVMTGLTFMPMPISLG